MAVQLLAAGAGIGAWIAVVGGARIWARLSAIDAPTSQAVSALPRELLITEGLRTLLVPLALGAAIALLAYFTRRQDPQTYQPTGDDELRAGVATFEDALEAARTALAAAKAEAGSLRSVKRAGDKLAKSAESAESDFPRKLAKLRSELADLEPRLEEVQTRFEEASEAVESAAGAALAAGREQREFAEVKSGYSTLREAHDKLTADLEPLLGDPPDAEPQSQAREAAAEKAKVVDLLPPPDRFEKDASRLLAELRRAGGANFDDGLRQLLRTILELGPVAYLRSWFGLLVYRYWIGVAIAMVVAVVLTFALLALPLVHALSWWVFGGVTAAAIGSALIILIPLHRRTIDDPFALITSGVLAAAVVAVPLVHERPWWAVALVGVAVFIGVLLVISLVRWGASAVAMCAPLAVITLAFFDALDWQYVLLIGPITLLTVWVSLGAMRLWNKPGGIAWVLFAAIAFWSGALAFIGERGATHTPLDQVYVRLKTSPVEIQGLYLGRTSKQVYVANAGDCDGSDCRKVLSIPDKDVTCLVFGPAVSADDPPQSNAKLADFTPSDPAGNPCASPAGSTKTPTPKPEAGSKQTWRLRLPSIRLLSPLHIKVDGSRGPGDVGSLLVLDTDMLFEFGKAELTPDARPRLRRVMAAIRASGANVVFVAGHTDSRGSRAKNEKLADDRVERVRAELDRLDGDKGPVIRPAGFGERRPVACNRKPDGSDNWIGRAYNRRVEIWTDQEPQYRKPDCPRTSTSP